MNAIVVYESMYGNTRAVAEAIGRGLAASCDVTVQPVADVEGADLTGVDLVVIGGPTHGWSMSRPSTRRGAADAAAKPDSALVLEPGATGPGIRELLHSLEGTAVPTAVQMTAFDTRMRAPLGLSGGASRAIAKRLRKIGIRCHPRPRGFYVTKKNQLLDGEAARAEAWGRELAGMRARSA